MLTDKFVMSLAEYPSEGNMNSPKYPTRCIELFLDYVKIDTQSSEDSETFPSTPGQLDVAAKTGG